MSDSEQNTIVDKIFCVEIAKQGRAACKKCKQKCTQGELRIAKLAPSPYGSGFMKNWHHVDCIFEASMKQRATTKRLQDPEEDLDGWDDLSADNQAIIVEKINDCEKLFAEKNKLDFKPIKYDKKKTPKKTEPAVSPGKKKATTPNKAEKAGASTSKVDPKYTESTFRDFRKLLANITNVSSYTDKTAAVAKVLSSGTFKGDVSLWCRLLLPGVLKRIYNVQSKQLVKLFSRIFNTNQEEMLEDLEKGDIGETIETFFNQSKYLKPASSSTLTLEEVDEFLEKLSTLTKEDEQSLHFKEFCRKCTANDLKVVIRLVKHDLRINAGAKHILEAIHPDAYKAYQASRDLNAVLAKCLSLDNAQVTASITVMTPVLPMLAEACKSVEQAMKKCPNGMYSEIKYDGERVQLHKSGSEFKYYSRSLKPVLGHKITHFKDYIPKAFPHAKDLILDCEVLMVDTNTGKPLPFGTLGKHKKNAFEDASVCLFVFDCIYYNGEDLTNKPLDLRKKMLKDSMVEIKNHVMFSEMEIIHKSGDLSVMIAKVLKLGLEGLVLKDIKSIYKPGKRHWLKVKKDYLFDGAMADSADLIVLGAWYGTGKKGGMMSVFLMGCYDPYTKTYKTVTKVHTGHDDETLERLQKELNMVKISCDIDKVPKWLDCTRTMIPDFVAKDPKAQPVWEITGAEFSQVYDVHTADGISIRFPRVTKIRDDKTWETATNLQELNVLYKNSKHTDVSLLLKNVKSDQDIKSEPEDDKTIDDSPKKNTKKRAMTTIVESPKKKIKLELKTTRSVTIQNPLPDYFDGVRLLLEDGTKDKYSELLRHFIAYSGQVLTERNCLKANYVLHGSEIVEDQSVLCSKSAKHITSDWIKDCIIRKEQLDYEKYAVIYIPKENYDDFD